MRVQYYLSEQYFIFMTWWMQHKAGHMERFIELKHLPPWEASTRDNVDSLHPFQNSCPIASGISDTLEGVSPPLPVRRTGREHRIAWPQRSCDLVSWHFYLSRYKTVLVLFVQTTSLSHMEKALTNQEKVCLLKCQKRCKTYKCKV